MLSRKLRTDYDVAIPLDLKTGDITRPEQQHEAGPRLLPGGHKEAVARAEDAVEAAILTTFFRVNGHPNGIDAVRIFGADHPGDGVDLARAHAVLVDGERQLRGPGPLSLAETRRHDDEG